MAVTSTVSSGSFDIKTAKQDLATAIKDGALEKVQALVPQLLIQGFKIDMPVYTTGSNFLHLAAYNNQAEIALELVNKYGASVNPLTDHGLTPMEIALCDKHYDTAAILLSMGGTREATGRKILAHIWGIKGDFPLFYSEKTNCVSVRAESFMSHLIDPELISLTHAFFTSAEFFKLKSPINSELIVKAIAGIAENATKSPTEITQQILKGEMVLMHVSWKDPSRQSGHAVGIGFKGNIVFKVNGAREKKSPEARQSVVKFFTISSTDNLEFCIAKLLEKTTPNFFNNELNEQLGLQVMETLVKSVQKTKQCTFASFKGLVHGVLQIECEAIFPNKEQASQEALTIYKTWKRFIRKAAYEHYKVTSTNPSAMLQKAVLQKKMARDSKYWRNKFATEDNYGCKN